MSKDKDYESFFARVKGYLDGVRHRLDTVNEELRAMDFSSLPPTSPSPDPPPQPKKPEPPVLHLVPDPITVKTPDSVKKEPAVHSHVLCLTTIGTRITPRCTCGQWMPPNVDTRKDASDRFTQHALAARAAFAAQERELDKVAEAVNGLNVFRQNMRPKLQDKRGWERVDAGAKAKAEEEEARRAAVIMTVRFRPDKGTEAPQPHFLPEVLQAVGPIGPRPTLR